MRPQACATGETRTKDSITPRQAKVKPQRAFAQKKGWGRPASDFACRLTVDVPAQLSIFYQLYVHESTLREQSSYAHRIIESKNSSSKH